MFLNQPEEEQEEVEGGAQYTADTALPQDLVEHLIQRKRQRENTIATTGSISKLFFVWAVNASGFFVARLLLVAGGSVNFHIAIALCFAICNIPTASKLIGFRVNYSQNLQVDEGQKLLAGAVGVGASAVTTYLAVSPFRHYMEITKATSEGIRQDIRTIERPVTQINVNLEMLAIAAICCLVASLMLFSGEKRKNER